MAYDYGLGIFFGLMAGLANAASWILQKHAVDTALTERREHGFMQYLLRNPRWLLGLGVGVALSPACTLAAQALIGPALVPGLGASGLVILAIGSVRLIGEKLKPSEVLGIALIVIGVVLLSASDLAVSRSEVDLSSDSQLLRTVWFTAGLALLWLLSFFVSRRIRGEPRGLTLAVTGGFGYAASNLWLLPLLVTIGPSLGGTANAIQALIFGLACIITVATNLSGIRLGQEAYKFAPASKVQPMMQVVTQTIPILIFFLVYQLPISGLALFLVPLAVLMIIVSGFLLARRTSELEAS